MSATRVKTLTAAMRGNPDWQAVLDLILKEFNCQTGTLHKWHDLHAMLELICHRGIPRELMDKIERIPMGKGIAGAAAERMEPVSMCNLQTDTTGVARPKAKKTSVGGNIAVPIDMGGLGARSSPRPPASPPQQPTSRPRPIISPSPPAKPTEASTSSSAPSRSAPIKPSRARSPRASTQPTPAAVTSLTSTLPPGSSSPTTSPQTTSTTTASGPHGPNAAGRTATPTSGTWARKKAASITSATPLQS